MQGIRIMVKIKSGITIIYWFTVQRNPLLDLRDELLNGGGVPLTVLPEEMEE